MVLNLCLSLVLLSVGISEAGELAVTAVSLQRKDLPDEFPHIALDKGFAILEIKLENNTKSSREFDLDKVQVFEKKGKRIERALVTDIAPKVRSFYSATSRDVHGEGYYGYPRSPTPGYVGQRQSSIPSTGGRTVDAGLGQRIRRQLENWELKTGPLEPGESREGYIYLKSKKSGNAISGGYVQVVNLRATF